VSCKSGGGRALEWCTPAGVECGEAAELQRSPACFSVNRGPMLHIVAILLGLCGGCCHSFLSCGIPGAAAHFPFI
jgi:hypothetical protein